MKPESFLIVAVVIIIGLAVLIFEDKSNTSEITDWLAKNDKKVEEIDARTFSTGPYMYMKNTMVYRVKATDGSVYWFRFGLMVDAIKRENNDGSYTELK